MQHLDRPDLAEIRRSGTLGTILVALDGSELAMQSLRVADALLSAHHATIRLVRVHETASATELPVPPERQERDRRRARTYLERTARRLRQHVDGEEGCVETVLLEGDPAMAIRAEAERSGAALIVACTHGRTGIRRVLLGSVADALVHHAPVPVLLLRATTGFSIGPRPFRRLLIALDGTPASEAMLPTAAAIATLLGVPCTLIRVVPPVNVPVLDVPMAPPVTVRDEASTAIVQSAAHAYLTRVSERLRSAGVTDIEAHVETSADIAHTIARHALAVGADLVAIVSHQRGASRLLQPSVADHVLRETPAGLLIAPGAT